MTLGENIKQARVVTGMTQMELAERLGIPGRQSFVSKIELQETPAWWERICSLADVLGVSLDDLRE